MAPWPFGDSNPNPPATPLQAAEQRTSPPSRPSVGLDRQQQEDNPFIAFRNFADAQFRILNDGLAAIPTILSDLQSRGADSRWTSDNFSQPAEQPLAFMSQHFEPPLSSSTSLSGTSYTGMCPYDPANFSSEAIAATRTLLLQARNANAAAGVRPESLIALYRDVPAFQPFGFGHEEEEPTWLSVDWFKRSAYSPAHLETHRHLHQQGSMWRAAFEDLMSATLDKECEARDAWTGRRNDQKLYSAWAQTPRDWMLGLQCRGVLPPQLPLLYNNDSRVADHVFGRLVRDDEEDILPLTEFWDLVREVGTFDHDEKRSEETPQTELDAYERFLGKASDKTSSTVQSSRSSSSESRTFTEADVAVSKILSTLSTTERTTLPDGTVTTKVVLKKRFSDGREESTETVSTTHALVNEQSTTTLAASTIGSSTRDGSQSKSKRGWFW